MEVQTEEADYDISWRHAAQGIERVLDVGRRKQTQNKLNGVLCVAATELYHIHEPAITTTANITFSF